VPKKKTGKKKKEEDEPLEEEKEPEEDEEEPEGDVTEEEEEEPEEDEEEEEEEKPKKKKKKEKKVIEFRTTSDANTSKWMMIANLTIIGGIIALINIQRWDRDEEWELVLFQSVQQILLYIPFFIGIIPVLGWIIAAIYAVIYVVMIIVAIVKANSGVCWEMPLAGGFTHKVLRDE